MTTTTAASLDGIPVAFASCSIGLERHTLHQKVEALSQAGFTGIELSMPDLVAFASRHLGRPIAEDDYASLCAAGPAVAQLCARHNLRIIVLQPFANFEGWPRGSAKRADAFARARAWADIMAAVGTDMLQVGSSDAPEIEDAQPEEMAADLAELADMLAPRGFRIAFENWCWATKASTWRDVWALVRAADRPNLGLCLDTFQSAGGEWADPTAENGRRVVGGAGRGPGETKKTEAEAEVEEAWRASLADLAREVPADKIFFLQISDAYRVQPPLAPEPDEQGLRPRGRWSHDYRPLPYDGGYLPVGAFAEAVLATGFRGWFSVEVFDGRFEEKYGDDLPAFARKAMAAHKKLLGEVSEEKVSNGLK